MKNEVLASTAPKNPSRGIGFSAVTTILAAAMPKCPICWMALASAVGVGSAINSRWLHPLSIALLLVPVVALYLRASRRAYGPFVLGLAAAAAMYLCKFRFGYDAGAYLSGAVLLGASVWNALPQRRADDAIAAGCDCRPPTEGEPHEC